MGWISGPGISRKFHRRDRAAQSEAVALPVLHGWFSPLSTLDGTYTVQLPRTFSYGKAFSLPFAVGRDVELSLTSDTVLIGPESEPIYLKAAGFRIGDNFISADTGNAGGIVSAKTSADPDSMFKRRMLQEQPVSILKRSFQCVALTIMNCIGERLDRNSIPPLQRGSPSMSAACCVVNTGDVAQPRRPGKVDRCLLSRCTTHNADGKATRGLDRPLHATTLRQYLSSKTVRRRPPRHVLQAAL